VKLFDRLPVTPAARGEPTRAPITGAELAFVVAATALGLALRVWHFDFAALTHFDEGVYAFTGLGLSDPSQPSRLFPDQQKFSPPLYFSLIALLNALGISPTRSPLLVNLAVGTVTIPVVWGVSRRWYGAAAAVTAAFLLAMSEFHIILSRSAMTDATFALTFVLALAAVLVAIERNTWRTAVVAGIAVGLAWNTKYHGWFALVIGAMAITGHWAFQRAGTPWLKRTLKSWLTMSLVASLCYVPWALFIQRQPGASAGWASYFATMLRIDWFGNFWQHVSMQGYMEGPWSRASVPLAWAAGTAVAHRFGQRAAPAWTVVVLGGVALLLGGAAATVLLAVVALSVAWRRGMTWPDWMLGSLLLLWLVMAPIYHPYARLLMPFTIATMILAGASLARGAAQGETAAGHRPRSMAGVITAAVVGLVATRLPDPSNPWRRAMGLPEGAAVLDGHLPPGAPVNVMGEPALAFYLHTRGHPSFGRTSIQDLDTLATERYVVTGIYLRRAPIPQRAMEARRDRFTFVERVPVSVPSDLRVLDDFRPDSARRWVAQPDTTYDLMLWKFTPKPPSR
jgi:4-amino-4-deoxy-L-arabinose transferase-like glycosyltransferase